MVRIDDRCAGRLVVAVAFVTMAGAALAQTTPQSPSSPQPVLPQQKPGSPVVESLVGQPPLDVRKPAYAPLSPRPARHMRQARLRHVHPAPLDLDRPALAGVELLAPVPHPVEPSHIMVPTPVYVFDELATPFLTPPPPVVCHNVRREPGIPDPHLYREVTVACVSDNP